MAWQAVPDQALWHEDGAGAPVHAGVLDHEHFAA
jgi:hypothetical protein